MRAGLRSQLVQVRRLAPAAWDTLRRLREGAALGDVCASREEPSPAPPVMKWFAEWLRNGVTAAVRFPAMRRSEPAAATGVRS